MGGSVRKFIRPRAYYDIERRALKQIEKEKDKPRAAPKHKTSAKDHEDVYANPDPSILMKNEQLNSRMKGMYLESYGSAPEVKSKSNRPLPENRLQVESTYDKYGYHIPNRVAHGKVNFMQMMELLRKYSEAKGQYSAADIAEDYKVDPVKIQNVLSHFQVLQIHLPKEKGFQSSAANLEIKDSKTDPIGQIDSKGS
ncbi:uncharacterized protein LOC134269359 [Saccostrea cucullata]|uniref:uncharacterized protein LOC134269359 n=1 Tax=Saccostrea cuccullata TaxID=36930 RepID=UPI002ED046D7